LVGENRAPGNVDCGNVFALFLGGCVANDVD
jgi:hypothetical protein